MASAGRNVRGSTWWQTSSQCRRARRSRRGRRTSRRADRAAAEVPQRSGNARGWDVGTLSSGDFGTDKLATFRYHVTVPGLTFFPTGASGAGVG